MQLVKFPAVFKSDILYNSSRKCYCKIQNIDQNLFLYKFLNDYWYYFKDFIKVKIKITDNI